MGKMMNENLTDLDNKIVYGGEELSEDVSFENKDSNEATGDSLSRSLGRLKNATSVEEPIYSSRSFTARLDDLQDSNVF